jgi:hypothetical protein
MTTRFLLEKEHQQQQQKQRSKPSVFLDRKIDEVTAGLRPEFFRLLYDISVENALSIIDYIKSMKTEVNLSDHYR